MSKAAPPSMPSMCWMRTAVAGKVRSGVAVAQITRSMSRASRPERSSAWLGGREAEIGRALAFGGDVARADAGALDDPLVGGVDDLGQIVVGHAPLGQIGADAADDGTDDSHAFPSLISSAPLHSGARLHGHHRPASRLRLPACPAVDSALASAWLGAVARSLAPQRAVEMHRDPPPAARPARSRPCRSRDRWRSQSRAHRCRRGS